MDDYGTHAKRNLVETCCASISLQDLKACSHETKHEVLDPSRKPVLAAGRVGDGVISKAGKIIIALLVCIFLEI
jgi:hypothetical protein